MKYATKKKRKKTAKRKRTLKPNPAAPSLRTDRLIPVEAIRVDKQGRVRQVVVRDKNLKKALKPSKKKR